MKVNTEFVNPPIYSRDFDWSATHDDYDEGDHIGWGRTEEEAISDLHNERISTKSQRQKQPAFVGNRGAGLHLGCRIRAGLRNRYRQD